jgi:hypothetical protein
VSADVVVQFPAHAADCPVCGGPRQVRWCSVHDGQADPLGSVVPCLALPILDVPMRVDVPRGGDAA